jgi:multimeric flavodoxin WrbA
MKVLAVVFSVRRGEKPLTLQMTEEVCRTVEACWGEGTETEIVTMSEMPVNACTGCKTCFSTGICPQDRADGMGELRKKLMECDALIVASPVYMVMVSGWCKNFLDRCASYCHVFSLSGKPCLVLSVTAMSGGQRTADYLSEMMEVMGCAVAGKLAFQKFDGEGLTVGSEPAKEAVNHAVSALRDAAENPEKYISERTEQQFDELRNVYRRLEVFWTLSGQKSTWEVETFRAYGYMNAASFRDALKIADGRRETLERHDL